MANPAPITKNLKSWKPGQSGNPKGRRVGSKNLTTLVRELLADDELANKLLPKKPRWWDVLPDKNGASAMVAAMLAKACEGDISAFSALAKAGWGNSMGLSEPEEREELPIYVIDLDPPESKHKPTSKA
jgi:hypothetical protein